MSPESEMAPCAWVRSGYLVRSCLPQCREPLAFLENRVSIPLLCGVQRMNITGQPTRPAPSIDSVTITEFTGHLRGSSTQRFAALITDIATSHLLDKPKARSPCGACCVGRVECAITTRDRSGSQVASRYAGERVMLGTMSTGAVDDIQRATQLARRMVTEFGMSEKLGSVRYAGDRLGYFGWGHRRGRGLQRRDEADHRC